VRSAARGWGAALSRHVGCAGADTGLAGAAVQTHLSITTMVVAASPGAPKCSSAVEGVCRRGRRAGGSWSRRKAHTSVCRGRQAAGDRGWATGWPAGHCPDVAAVRTLRDEIVCVWLVPASTQHGGGGWTPPQQHPQLLCEAGDVQRAPPQSAAPTIRAPTIRGPHCCSPHNLQPPQDLGSRPRAPRPPRHPPRPDREPRSAAQHAARPGAAAAARRSGWNWS
jgi:hypothetical protein